MAQSHVTRRAALAGSAAAIAVAAVWRPGAAQATTRLRKNILALDDTELAAYKHAVQIMKDRSSANPDDPTGYDYYASLHDYFDDGVHSGCQHGMEMFLPWHRRLLYDFEAELQKTDPATTANVMVPYWDWTVALPAGALYPAPFTDRNSPLYDRTRRNISPPPYDANEVKGYIKDGDWSLFAGRPAPNNSYGTLESHPHNTLHGNISTHMASPSTAAEDPIFWSFHAGIDLCWSRWQKLHLTGGAKQTYVDPAATMYFRNRSYTVGSVTTTTDFEHPYDYAYDFSIDHPTSALVATVAAPHVASIAMPPKRSFAAKRQRASGSAEEFAIAAPAAQAASTVLKLADIKVFGDRTYRLEVFLHPKTTKLAPNTSAKSPYHVDTITVWQQHMDTTVAAYIKPTPAQLADLGKGWVLSVQSHDLAAPSSAMPAMAMAAPAPKKRTPAVAALIGGISLEER